MRKPSAVAVLSVLLALSGVSFLATSPRAAEEAKPAFQQWEYKVAMIWTGGKTDEEKMAAGQSQLSQAGEQGWELVQVQLAYGIFKRPKQ